MGPQLAVSRKSEVAVVVAPARREWAETNAESFVAWLTANLLRHRVKFPLLEFFALELATFVPRGEQQPLIVALAQRPEHGSSVIIGKLLQLWLPDALAEAFGQARTAITSGATWYHCDQIGERVFGHGLLTAHEDAWPRLTVYLRDDDAWVQRAVGVAVHYATKKGLAAAQVETVLSTLLLHAGTDEHEARRGIGWGLKTIAKLHPDMMRAQLERVPADSIAAPVRRKIRIGLGAADKRRHGQD